MKRKDLYNYVRQEIINELTEEAVTWNSSTKSTAKQQIDKSKLSGDVKNQAKAEIDQNPSGLISNVSENDLEEDRKGSNFKAGPNFANIKRIYAGSVIERILNTIEEAGDVGIEPKNMQAALGIKHSSELNPIKKELLELGAIVGPAPKEAEAEPEETTPEDDLINLGIPKVTDNPEEEEDVKDDYYKPEEEEDSTEEEPKDVAVSDTETEKIIGGKAYAKKLTPEEEDVIEKYKNAIVNKSKILRDKKASTDDKAKAKAALDSYKKKEDLKKLFNKKGSKSLIDFINDELNK